MNKILHIILITIAFLIFQGCAYSVHEMQVSDFSKPVGKNANMVEADSEQFVILSFAFDTDYVDQAYDRLQEKCPKGEIHGISTKYSTDLGFFSWTNRIKLRGVCLAKGE